MIHFCVFQELAVKNESGLSENPLKILWLEGQPEVIAPTSQPGQFMSQVPVLPENAFFSSPSLIKHVGPMLQNLPMYTASNTNSIA